MSTEFSDNNPTPKGARTGFGKTSMLKYIGMDGWPDVVVSMEDRAAKVIYLRVGVCSLSSINKKLAELMMDDQSPE